MALESPGRSGGAPAPQPAPNAERKPRATPDAATLKAQQQRQILAAQEQVSLQSGDRSLQLTLRAAIDAINQRLAPSLGDNALQQSLDSGLDQSPEATAERIVSLSTGLFARYQDAHPEFDTPQQAERFAAILREGVDQGFAEARDILDGLKVLGGDIASNIDRTYQLVQQGLRQFVARFDGSGEAETDGA